MKIRSRFFIYLFSLIALSIGLGELLAVFSYQLLHLLAAVGLVVGFLVLLLLIYKDFLKPMLSIEKWVNHYKQHHQPEQNERNIFISIQQVLNHLSNESEGLYDEMNEVLQTQIKRLSKKSGLLETLYAVSSSLNEIRSLDDLLQHLLQLFINMTEANSGVIRLIDKGNELNIASIIGNIDTKNQVLGISGNACLCYKIAHDRDARVQFSVHTCAKCVGQTSERECSYGTIFIPLQHQRQTLGIVSLFFDKTPSLSEDERALLKAIGSHLAIALDKARIDANARRLSLNQERLFLSQDLHDSLSQVLYSLGLQTSALLDIIQKETKQKALGKAKDLEIGIGQANRELRNLLNNFRKPLDISDLVSSIKHIAAKFENQTKTKVFVHCLEPPKVPLEVEQQIIYIVQEALTNIKKHAAASNVRLLLNKNSVIIEDDGSGFNVSKAKSRAGYHLGLDILKERAARIGASIHIESEENEGTQITLKLSL